MRCENEIENKDKLKKETNEIQLMINLCYQQSIGLLEIGNVARNSRQAQADCAGLLAPTTEAQFSIYFLFIRDVVQCESLRGYKYTTSMFIYIHTHTHTLSLSHRCTCVKCGKMYV